MKKILFFIESLVGGGAEKVLTDLVKNLDQQKYEITVCTVTDGDIYQAKISQYSIYKSLLSMEEYNKGGFDRFKFKVKLKLIYSLPTRMIYKVFIKKKYDLEIAFIEGYATKFIAASTNRVSKKIAWIHTDMKINDYALNSYKNMKNHKRTYLFYNKICCVSQKVKEVFSDMFFDDKKVIVQYNPVDSAEVISKGKEPIELSKNSTLQLGTIGRLEEQKGYLRLVECLGKLKKEGFDFSLWIAGEGSKRGLIENLIKEYKLEENVVLLGFQSNPYKYMEKCDAFVCSSYAEGFSTAATESLILGKPIFTTECAGMQELFGNEKCGEIVPNTDEALFMMLKNLMNNTWKINSYIPGVLKRAKDFDIRTRMREIEEILDEE